MLTFDEIKETLEFFDDWKDRYNYIIDIGKRLPTISPELQIDSNLVRGCQSSVWLVMNHDLKNDRVSIQLDSDALIVKGLIVIVLSLVQNRSPSEIVRTDTISSFEQIGLMTHLTRVRGNGLRAMVERIRLEAASFQESSATSN